MKYLHILLACACEPWAMDQVKLRTVTSFLLFKARGGELTPEEVQARITQRQERETARAPGSVGVLPVRGVIMHRANLLDDISGGTSTEAIAAAFRAMLADDKIKAIIMDVDSPGGMVQGVAELADEIYESRGRKPIIAQVNAVASSAAYWLAAQADEVVATPTARGGSIGVYTIHEDISKFLETQGIKETFIYAGRYKVEGNEYEPLGDEARAHIQQLVNESYDMFVRSVARGRSVPLRQVNDRFGQGRLFGAAEMVDRGMADRVDTLRGTLGRFGVVLNPAARGNVTRAEALGSVEARLRAGERLTKREWESYLRGTAGLSNSEVERAVNANFEHEGSGGPGTNLAADQDAVARALTEVRRALDGFPDLTKV